MNKIKSDVEHWKNCYYKAYADTENLRKSIEKDHREAIKYRAEGFVNNLLGILDGFHMALNNEVKSEELKNYLVGFQYIYNNLVKVLEDEGVKEIIPKNGDSYDERTMEAVETEYREDIEAGKVVKVLLKGYQLKDHLVRPAMVVVSTKTKKEEAAKENATNQKDA